MKKYGVEELKDQKTAEENNVCPVCGEKLPDPQTTGGILICEECGTEPFEAEE